MDLETLTHDELDALADERDVRPYPSSGVKADKVAAIRAADLPETCTAVANVPLSGWPRGEIREVAVDDRLLRRAANGLVSVLAAGTVPAPRRPAGVDLDAPAAAHDLDDLDVSDLLEDAVDQGRQEASALAEALAAPQDEGEDGPTAAHDRPHGDEGPSPLSSQGGDALRASEEL
jgi:hypothetical protein